MNWPPEIDELIKAFGELVTAPDVERLPADAGPTHFVRVCGALIRWALVEHGAASAGLQIAERLNVPDRGADAECALPDTTIETGGFVGPGRTIFQFKYRDVGAADRKTIVSSLAARLREELRTLPAGCDRYVLMTNVSLAGTQPSRLREATWAGAPALATKPVMAWGAAEIANALNASPGLRHLFTAAGGALHGGCRRGRASGRLPETRMGSLRESCSRAVGAARFHRA